MLPDGAARLLDERERSRAEAYRFAGDRTRFELGAVLLRAAAARALGTSPSEVAVDRTCDTCGAPHGRPRVGGSGLHVSVAHSGDWVAVAVTAAGPVGVDVEAIAERSDPDRRELVAVVCAPEEQGFVVDPDDFFAYWTRKEAVLKATGDGLRLPMSEVVVTAPDLAPELLTLSRRDPPQCSMSELPLRAGYRGAVAVLAAGPISFVVRDAAELLASV